MAAQEADRLAALTAAQQKIEAVNRELAQKNLSEQRRAALEEMLGIYKQEGALAAFEASRPLGENQYRAAPGAEAGRGVIGERAGAEADFKSRRTAAENAQLQQLGLTQRLVDGVTAINGLINNLVNGAHRPLPNLLR
jgi:hypothetical protein